MSFYDALTAHGLRPRTAVAPDGKWHRCATENHPRKKNGSYKLAVDGRIGWFLDFALDTAPHTWRPDKSLTAEPYDPSWLKKAQADARERLQKRTDAARLFYESCSPLIGGHPYLEKHGLDMTGAFGLRVDTKGWLVVPAYRNRQLTTVQRISPDGEKRFWSGASVKGASYRIERRNAALTVLCEGLATGMAIFAAVPESRVVVAFNAGNLANITVPTGLVVIAADNDWETERRLGKNPGVVAANEAATALGCGVAVPDGIEGTDWCDWRCEIYEARLQQRRPKEREGDIRRAVDAQLRMLIKRNARFVVTTKSTQECAR